MATPEQIERISLYVGDMNRASLRATWMWGDSVEVAVSNGPSFMGHRLYPDDMERLASWLWGRAADIRTRQATPE